MILIIINYNSHNIYCIVFIYFFCFYKFIKKSKIAEIIGKVLSYTYELLKSISLQN